MNWSDFKRGPETIGWLRAPAAEKFAQNVGARAEEALASLMGTCAVSEDPRVARAYGRWNELDCMAKFLVNGRKESNGDDE